MFQKHVFIAIIFYQLYSCMVFGKVLQERSLRLAHGIIDHNKTDPNITVIPENVKQFNLWFNRNNIARSIVNIYVNQMKRKDFCRGTLVHSNYVVTTCSCVVHDVLRQSSGVTEAVKPLNVSLFRIISALDDLDQFREELSFVADDIELHPRCDSDFEYDYAVIRLPYAIQATKTSWVALSHSELLTNFIDSPKDINTSNCQIIDFNAKNIHGLSQIVFESKNVTFESWHHCYNAICSEVKPSSLESSIKSHVMNRCMNRIPGTRYCIKSRHLKKLCSLPSGTPVFCSSPNVRGLVGILSHSMLMNGCPNLSSTPSVLFALSEFAHELRSLISLLEVDRPVLLSLQSSSCWIRGFSVFTVLIFSTLNFLM